LFLDVAKNYLKFVWVVSFFCVCSLFSEVSHGGKTVSFEFYYSLTCEHCDSIIKEYVYPLKNNPNIHYDIYEIDENLDNYERLIKREKEFGDEGNEIPVIFIGKRVLGGSEEVRKEFPALLENELAKTKIAKGDIRKEQSKAVEDVVEHSDSNALSESDLLSITEDKTHDYGDSLFLVYFYKSGCSSCLRVTHDLRLIQRDFPNLTIMKFDVEEHEGAVISEFLSNRNNIPDIKHLASPAVFTGDTFILTEDISAESIRNAIISQGQNASERIWELSEDDYSKAESRIKDRFERFSIWAILGAGFADGVNPCAFGVIIFFITFLTTLKKSRKDIIITGLTFAFSVFTTYLLVGAGLLKFLVELPFFVAMSKWVYLLTAILSFILGVVSVVDFFRSRKGEFGDMVLKLPDNLKKKIHKKIMTENSPRAKRNIIIAAASTGFLISLMELACTGQVYLPTIILMTKAPGTQGTAFLYLVLYNLVFILPLLVIFAVAVFGVSNNQLTNFLKKQTGTIKIILAVIFFALAYFLLGNVSF